MIEIKVPSPGESITQVQIARWLVEDNAAVEKDQEIVEIDSDKATFPVASPVSGRVTILVPEGESVAVDTVIAKVEEGTAGKQKGEHASQGPNAQIDKDTVSADPQITSAPPASHTLNATPLARQIIAGEKLDPGSLASAFPGKRITRKEIESFASGKKAARGESHLTGDRTETRRKLSTLRLKLAERLVSVKNETAMLTTFNEVNMRKLLNIKEKYNDEFKEKFGAGIGLMSFFTKAATIALQEFPEVNSMIEGEDLVMPGYVDMGIAVSAPKGLMVPVIRNTESLSIAEIEIRIKELAARARDNRITIDDMKGGTFTISNGGVFGSLMSTPILNPPQSAILGMHKIIDRPVAVGGRVEIHPMMYLALSYDHRLIDGRESVSFLLRIKELVEEPADLLTEGMDIYRMLLDI